MESAVCCFLIPSEDLARISKECGVSVEFQQELAAVCSDSSSPADTSVQGVCKQHRRFWWGENLVYPLLRVFVRENHSGVPWLAAEHMG